MIKNFLWTGVIGALLFPNAGTYAASGVNGSGPRSAPKADFGLAAPVATPEGVTLQAPTRARRGGSAEAKDKAGRLLPALLPRLDLSLPKESDFIYADARGMTMYTYDKDAETLKPTCVDECAKAWPAAIAPDHAKPLGDWSLIARSDGHKQWSYKGKPLYTFAKDVSGGDVNGNGAQSGAWHTVAFKPLDGFKLPVGFAVEPNRRVNGQALVDSDGMTVYFFDGKPGRSDGENCKLSSCTTRWTPVAAAQLARPVGDFSVVSGANSTRQWAYKGRPLFTFGGDLARGDAHGDGVDAKWHAAVLVKYFAPPEARVAYDEVRGALLTTASGMTLYRQGVSDHSLNNRSIPYARPGTPAIARAVGVSAGCSGPCLNDWRPFKAREGATPSGYWGIAVREDDGSRQWVYKGHPLYLYAGDKKPGDMNGNDVFGMPSFDETKQTDALWVLGMQQGVVLYWAFMAP